MKKSKAQINIENNKATKEILVFMRTNSHYYIDICTKLYILTREDILQEIMISSCEDLLSTKAQGVKLNKQFAHATSSNPKKWLVDGGITATCILYDD